MACENDFDCPGTLVCYANLTWQDEGDSFCGCSNYYGWEGADCTELSIQGKLYLAFASIFAIANIIPFLLFITDLRFFIRVAAARDSNNTTLTLLYSAVALCFLGLYGCFLIGSLLSPKQHDVKISNSDEKFSRFGQGERVTSLIGAGLVIIASMNVSLMWIEVADRIRNYKREQVKHVSKYKNIIRGFQVVFLAVMIACIGFGLFFIVFLIMIPFELIMIFSYIRGRISFANVLVGQELPSSKSTEYTRLANRVKRTSSTVIVCIIAFGVTTGIFSYMLNFDWRNYSEPGHISYAVLALNVCILSVIIWNLTIFVYARTSFVAFVKGKETSLKTDTAHLQQRGSSFVNSNRKDSFTIAGSQAHPEMKQQITEYEPTTNSV